MTGKLMGMDVGVY